jgi:hypothetical protein
MWKKLDDPAGARPDLTSNDTPDSTSLGDSLLKSVMNEHVRKADPADDAPNLLTDNHNHPLALPNMRTYTEAMEEFTTNATAFIEQLPRLTKARAAYEEAMMAVAEVRKVLDAGEEKLRNLRNQLEQGINLAGSAPSKKYPEPTKFEDIMRADEGRGGRGVR